MKRIPSLLLMATLLLTGVSISSALDVTARYFRFTQTKLRDNLSANSIQLSEFDLLFQGTRLTGATASNPGGNSPAGEVPAFAVDGSTTTKWLDFNKASLVLTFPAPVTADGYRFATGGDATERDPVSWTLSSSDDGITYTEVESKTDYPVTVARSTYTPAILFQSPVPLTIVSFVTDRPKIGMGETAKLIWNVVGSTSVTIDNGVGIVTESGNVVVAPSVETTYTLTASKGAETLTAQATVKPIATGPHTFQYYRFTPVTLRAPTANSVAISEFQMLDGITPLSGATATNPGGDSFSGEGPASAVDGLTTTKWLDFNKRPLVLNFGFAVEVSGYRFATANDFDERDPVSWTLEGSSDGNSWEILDTVTNFPTPLGRFTFTGDVPLPAVLAPTATFSAAPIHLPQGAATTLVWTTTGAATVSITPAVTGGTALSGTATVVPPTGLTTYTLTATNTTGVTTRTVKVQAEGPARQVTWQYFRFTPTTLRDGGAADSVQLAELELSLNGQRLTGATVTNPGGDNPATELPEFAADGDTSTKWLDFNRAPLVLQYPVPVTIDGYRLATANDSPERDPFAWTLEGSADGAAWTPIDTRDIGFVIPEDRQIYTSTFRFAGSIPSGKTYAVITGVSYGGNSLTVTWNSEAGRTYLIERSTDLATWTTALDNIPATGASTTQAVSAPESRLFLQVVQKP